MLRSLNSLYRPRRRRRPTDLAHSDAEPVRRPLTRTWGRSGVHSGENGSQGMVAHEGLRHSCSGAPTYERVVPVSVHPPAGVSSTIAVRCVSAHLPLSGMRPAACVWAAAQHRVAARPLRAGIRAILGVPGGARGG